LIDKLLKPGSLMRGPGFFSARYRETNSYYDEIEG